MKPPIDSSLLTPDSRSVDEARPSRAGITWTTDHVLRVCAFSSTGEAPRIATTDSLNHDVDQLFESAKSNHSLQKAHRQALLGNPSTFDFFWAERTYQGHVAPIRDPEGTITGCVGFAMDLDDHQRAEQALRESEIRYRAISELTETYAYSTRLDADGTLVLEWVIGDFVQITGYSLDEIKALGGPLTLVHPADRPIAVKRTERLLAGHPHISEFRIITKSGATRWLRDYGRPVRDSREKWTARFYGTAQDITDRKQAEQALQKSEERFRLAFEEGPLGMVVLNQDGKLLQFNRAMSQFLGYATRDIAGLGVENITSPEDLGNVVKAVGQAVSGGQSRHCLENRYLRKDGQAVWGRTTLTPLHDDDGKIMCILAMIEDITSRKRTEETLRRAERLASIGTLAAGIAHEINNPLGAIMLSVDAMLLSADQENKEEIEKLAMENIRTSTARCGRIVKSVLQFARDEASHKGPDDWAEVVRRAAAMVRSFAANQEIRLELDIEDGLRQVNLNPTEMTQVCVNLISNAIHASKPGDSVIVRLHHEGDSIQMDVVDHGHGISKENLGRIFDPFFTTKASEGGTGLGLSITYGIVEQHNGTTDVRSVPGEGTTVSVTLPVFKKTVL